MGVDPGEVSLDALLDASRGLQPREVRLPSGASRSSIVVRGMTHDSRVVEPGWMFCCIPGVRHDGHDHAPAAVAAGAVALLCERPLDLDVAQVVVENARRDMGRVAAAFHGHPADRLEMVGVTGTNGKTTTTHLLAAVLDAAGRRTGVLGTLSGVHTTPESTELQARLADLERSGVTAVAMEVSSHALALHRVEGVRFRVGVFTNLGRDHLDFHGTVERYFEAKARLFTPALAERGVVNADDVHGRLLADGAEIPIVTFGLADAADLDVGPTHHAYTWRGERVRVGIGGAFNVMNSLAAATTAAELGIRPAVIAEALASAPPVPGRFEPVDAGQDFAVIVDYAHTPDGLRQAIEAARRAASGPVTVVFGCGGDRDRDKRPEMGAVASALADHVVVTSDNPRSEEPEAIIADVLSGVAEEYRRRVSVEPDRRAAIGAALRSAPAGGVVLIAGKGHETTQTMGSRVVPFDDRRVARELLESFS